MTIECIKGFFLDDGALPIMQGERFRLQESSDWDEMVFVALEEASLHPGMEIEFLPNQLVDNFKILPTK
jgi:hypothetical protein